jgi:4-diphosphocytidyl-2-C-methyl-D-erythritol kinase (EC 2.7.1.148)
MVISDYFEIERAYAKLNLYLDVLSKRPDGYHNITGLFQTIDLHDELEISQIDKRGEVRIETNIEIQGTNLIEKAFRTVEKFYNVSFGIKVRLKKTSRWDLGLVVEVLMQQLFFGS